ncbi:uroporphyrin-III C-methyltransferase [Melanogaster broomeanus]|nr:uroporphyrin-III C-methyltransferase [Melanogaster broomeanus]
MDPFPPPTSGASLLLSFRMHKKTMLIVGGDTLAASRAYAALEADSAVRVLVKGGLGVVCEELRWRSERGQLDVVDWGVLPVAAPDSESKYEHEPGALSEMDRDVAALDRYLAEEPAISLVCITDTLSPSPSTSYARLLAARLARLCRSRRIPVNVTDMPELCDFAFATVHRFVDPATRSKTALQVGVTTNGEGCRLAGRIRRDIVAGLAKEVGGAVVKSLSSPPGDEEGTVDDVEMEGDGEEGEDSGVLTPNRPVPMRGGGSNKEEESRAEATRRHMKWVAQVSEYWPISRLAAMTEREMRAILNGGVGLPAHDGRRRCSCKRGRIPPRRSRDPAIPPFLTLATHSALTKHADLVLSDKLVPAAVLDLVPPHVEVRIARKFPGNADGAQVEMMEAAVDAANRGLTVVRLKQGDPIVYGRAGEEIIYFRSHGYAPLVIPGISSALAAPMFAGIPVTHRGVADSFVVCTGVGRQGRAVKLPGYEQGRTVLVLMGVARLGEVVKALVGPACPGRRDGAAYPVCTPISIIERGSMPDQRGDVESALASVGEQRPPGMMVIGWAVLALGWGA